MTGRALLILLIHIALGGPCLAEQTRVYVLDRYVGAELEAVLSQAFDERVTIVAKGNRLIASGSEEALEGLERTLKQIDKPRRSLKLGIRTREGSQRVRLRIGDGERGKEPKRLGNLASSQETSLLLLEGTEGSVVWAPSSGHRPILALFEGDSRGMILGPESSEPFWGWRLRPILLDGQVLLQLIQLGSGPTPKSGRPQVATQLLLPPGEWVALTGSQISVDATGGGGLSEDRSNTLEVRVDVVR